MGAEERAAERRARSNRSTMLRLTLITGVLLALVLVGLRLMPGSPFASTAAARWGESNSPAGSTGTTPGRDRTTPTPTPSPELPPLPVAPARVKIDKAGWWNWALIDTRTGRISGSANMDETNPTASMIKAWIGADFLRRAAEQGDTPSDTRMNQVSIMIRDSDNTAAQTLYEVNGGTASIKRLISICDLTDSSPAADGGWSRTALSARDAARLGACIADGRAAGPKWTKWLLDEMRKVRGGGNFGIRKAFPAAEQKTIAIKNGWVDRQREQKYTVNCLAIGDGWTMAVETRYAINLGYGYGAEICQDVARQLRAASEAAT
ncbi:serine hydrolase [Micromonospora sp. WMMD1102]|uniref:serine hydrolase n=1 Tax=Micromonospora sp. WMMD1102 TaxID=3016105 RepID=UPI002415967C|nr:serine hydrolase [Micromonospora sp. WMMD1102]MDG4790551.1 serine hydrolase [Micromonospora sp. WMMD1102]